MGYQLVTSLDHNIVYSALLDESNRLIEIHPDKLNDQSMLGNIYIGKVSNIVKGIGAIFIHIGMEKGIFLQVQEGQHFIYTNNQPSHLQPKIGDELLIQITKDEYLSKSATATSMLNITGRYSVLTYKKNFVGLSSKIRKFDEKKRLKAIFNASICEDYGFIVRTNAEDVAEEDLIKERDTLVATFNKVLQYGKFRTLYQCIYKEPEAYIKLIRDIDKRKINRYVFDDEALYRVALNYFNDDFYHHMTDHFELYSEPNYNLFQLHGLGSKIEKALQEKVWLNSGANLFIQLTEALIVIDVNTSKSTSKKNFEDTVFNINKEAANEIAKQIRLRNLSGIIIVDFIDMQEEAHNQELLNLLQGLFNQDRIKTTLVDMTPLGLVEITRKKIDKNIYEKFRDLGKRFSGETLEVLEVNALEVKVVE